MDDKDSQRSPKDHSEGQQDNAQSSAHRASKNSASEHSEYAAVASGVSEVDAPEGSTKEVFAHDLPAAIEESAGLDSDKDDQDGVTDRAVIIGRDGRWLAGWALRFIILVGAGFLLWQGLAALWVGILPILLALIACTVLWPPVKLLRSWKAPSALAVIITLLGFFGILGGIIAAIAPSVARQTPELVNRATEGVQTLIDWAQGPPLNIDLSQVQGALDDVTSFLQERSGQIASGVYTGITSATSAAVTLLVMLVLTFFFLKDGTGFLPWMRKFTGGNVGWHLTEVLSRSWNTLAGFIRAQALVSLVDAFFIGLGLIILDVPLAMVLAIITFFAGFIPIVGAVTAGALAVLIALVSNGLTNALLVLLIIILVQQLEGNVLQPVIQSRAMSLHAAIVLLSVTVGSTLFGIIGAFLAVPIAAVATVWLRYHSEMVALRAGEITVDDIQLATSQSESMSAQESLNAVRERLRHMGRRKSSVNSIESEVESPAKS